MNAPRLQEISAYLRRQALRTFLRARRGEFRFFQTDDLSRASSARGLSIEDVAAIADVTVPWYFTLEMGIADKVTDEMISRVAQALHLNPAERRQFDNLLAGLQHTVSASDVDPSIIGIIHDFAAPACIITRAFDVLAWNDAFAYVWAVSGSASFNLIVRAFTDESMRAMLDDGWHDYAKSLVAGFRFSFLHDSQDARLIELLEAFSDLPEFVMLWQHTTMADPQASSVVEVVSPNVGRVQLELRHLTAPARNEHTLSFQIPSGPTAPFVRALLGVRYEATLAAMARGTREGTGPCYRFE